MKLPVYIAMLRHAEQQLADALEMFGVRHDREGEMRDTAEELAAWSRSHITQLDDAAKHYGEDKSHNEQIGYLRAALFHGVRVGGMGLLMDLQDLHTLAGKVQLLWMSVAQAAKSIPDPALDTLAEQCCAHTERQILWLNTNIKITSPQALLTAPDKRSEAAASVPKKAIAPSAQQEIIWVPLAAGGALAAVAALALIAGGQPWLVPSLGPTVLLQASEPAHPGAKFVNAVGGHVAGLAAGFACVAAFGAMKAPGLLTAQVLGLPRALAGITAVALTALLNRIFKFNHLPAAATTLLVTSGAIKNPKQVVGLLIGVVIASGAGELLRRVRLGRAASPRPRQTPSPLPFG